MPNVNGAPQGRDDPRKKDYAIVVGVARYPELIRDGKPADLKGSAFDAKKIYDWLVSDSGGGVPPENIEYVIRAAGRAENEPDPSRDAVAKAFTCMWDRCWTKDDAPKTPPVGRRLYVYVSGHGLTGDGDHGVLLCSNSSSRSYATVGPHLSIQDFRKAGFFQEFVVWFDGCMDWTSVASQPIDYQPPAGNDLNAPGPVFAAYAAKPRLRTVEVPDQSGQVGGIFTRALLAGLKGDAAENAQIDSKSLEKYLYNAMPNYLPAALWQDNIIAKQPFIKQADPGIVFHDAATEPDSSIVLNIGAKYDGAEAQLWGNDPEAAGLKLLGKRTIAKGSITISLPKGFYFVVVPEHSLRQGFEVIGGGAKLVSEG